MKPQSEAFLEKAHELVLRAPALLAHGFSDEAGRAAYLAGFHAAQALLFERKNRVVKTHRGVQSESSLLIKDDPRFDFELRSFLGRTYLLKDIADYETGPGAKVPEAQAARAIDEVRRFVEAIEGVIGP